MSDRAQAELRRWDEVTPLGETAMRQKLESMGYRCSRYDYPPGTFFDEHSHAEDKIDAVLSGQFRITVGPQQFDLQAGDYLYVPRGVVHKAEVVGNETVSTLDGVRTR